MTAREDRELAALAAANGEQAAPLQVTLATHPQLEGKFYMLEAGPARLALPEHAGAEFALTLLADYFGRHPLRVGQPPQVDRELLRSLALAITPQP